MLTRSKPLILVIDDEPMIFKMFKNSFFNQEFELYYAPDGAKGLELFNSLQPDIVLLDIYMPILDGYEFLMEIQPQLEDPYEVIVITGDDRDEVITHCYALGVSSFLHKPINLIEAGERIKRAVKIKQLNQANKDIELKLRSQQKLQAIGQLSAGIAHEVNTPMQFINNNITFLNNSFNSLLTLLEETNDIISNPQYTQLSSEAEQLIDSLQKQADYDFIKEEIPKALYQSKEGVDRVTAIIHAMKEFSHPGAKELVKIDINRSIENTLIVASNELKYLTEVKANLDYNLPLIQGYINEINQALLNIIINSAHAIEDKLGHKPKELGNITIETSSCEFGIEIRIQDSGIGISKEHQTRIFEPFYTTKMVGKGTGQGLSIAYNVIVNQHHGKIYFDSEPGIGTTFYIQLPVKQANT